MKMVGTDPDLGTIVSRISAGDLDLQPDFQRGEVWGDTKKRRLIDTILRGWHVPPVHVIELQDSAREVVLDGQQRLTTLFLLHWYIELTSHRAKLWHRWD